MNKITILSFVVLLVSFIFTNHLLDQVKKLKEERNQLINFANSENQEIEFYQNKFNQEVAKVSQLEINLKTLREIKDNEKLAFFKEFDGLKKRLGNLEHATVINTRTVNNFKTNFYDTTVVNVNLDSALRVVKAFKWSDKYSSLNGYVTKDSLHVTKQQVDVPLKAVAYWDRKWFLGKKHWYFEAKSDNPNAKITKLDHISVQKK
jgi:hypothetical protein